MWGNNYIERFSNMARNLSLPEIINPYRLFGLMQQGYCFLPYHLGNGRAFPPLRYQLHLTMKCNLNCRCCLQHNRGAIDELSTDEWLNIIHQIPRFSVITISGGEVTVRPDFKTLLDHSLRQAKLNLITNATLLDDEMIQMFVERKLFVIGISLDGLGATHDRLRGKDGAFEKTMKNLEKLVRIRKGRYPIIDIKAIILEDNVTELPALYKLIAGMRCDFFTMSFLKGCELQYTPEIRAEFGEEFYKPNYPLKTYFNMGLFAESYKELLALSARNKTKLRFNPEFLNTRSDRELELIRKFFRSANSKKMENVYYPCVSPWQAMALLPNGDVFPCLSYKMGNAKKTPLKDIWNNDRYLAFRRKIKQHKLFSSCQSCCYCRIMDDRLP